MEKKHKNIAHPAIVEKLAKGQVVVRIQQQSACGNCKTHSHCSMADSSGKLVEVAVKDSTIYQTGQQVTLFLQESLGYKALWLGYLLPFLILLTTIILMVVFTGNDALAAVAAIAIMIPYYALLYKRRNILRKTFAFKIK